jgi:hypothetical protein
MRATSGTCFSVPNGQNEHCCEHNNRRSHPYSNGRNLVLRSTGWLWPRGAQCYSAMGVETYAGSLAYPQLLELVWTNRLTSPKASVLRNGLRWRCALISDTFSDTDIFRFCGNLIRPEPTATSLPCSSSPTRQLANSPTPLTCLRLHHSLLYVW